MIENQLQNKRQKFRQQIRRNQIQKIFAVKRKIHNQIKIIEQTQTNKLSLNVLLRNLKMNVNMQYTICSIANQLRQDNTLKLYQQQFGTIQLNTFCRDVVYTIINCIMPTLNLKNQQHTNLRLLCLQLLSNLFADSLTPHNCLLQILCQGLCSFYGSVKQWGQDIQMVQVGWIIANILCHKSLFKTQYNIVNIQNMLVWSQQLISIQQSQMIVNLYRAIKQFFKNVDQRFKVEDQNSIQHFKIFRLILLQKTIQYNINQNMGTSILSILKFITFNLQYLKQCDQRLLPILLKSVMKMINNQSDNVIKQIWKIVKFIIRQKPQQTAKLIIKKYFDTILINLQYQGVKVKIQLIQIITLLCQPINHIISDCLEITLIYYFKVSY